MISERTKAALQAAKARGKRLGQPKGHKIRPIWRHVRVVRLPTRPTLRPSPSACVPFSLSLRACQPTLRLKSLIAGVTQRRAVTTRLLTFALGSACYEALPHIHP
jgi:hypothetical protein